MSKPASGAVAPISSRITVIDGQPTTTTRDIAEVFGKRHDNILQIVRERMVEAGEWGLLNFKDTPYADPQNGQTYPVIRMTEKGFMFVVQKFTGKKAVATQIAFVDEFERMRLALQQKAEPQPDALPPPWTNALGNCHLLVSFEDPSKPPKVTAIPTDDRYLVQRNGQVSRVANNACILSPKAFMDALAIEPAMLRVTDEQLWDFVDSVIKGLRKQHSIAKRRADGKPVKFEL